MPSQNVHLYFPLRDCNIYILKTISKEINVSSFNSRTMFYLSLFSPILKCLPFPNKPQRAWLSNFLSLGTWPFKHPFRQYFPKCALRGTSSESCVFQQGFRGKFTWEKVKTIPSESVLCTLPCAFPYGRWVPGNCLSTGICLTWKFPNWFDHSGFIFCILLTFPWTHFRKYCCMLPTSLFKCQAWGKIMGHSKRPLMCAEFRCLLSFKEASTVFFFWNVFLKIAHDFISSLFWYLHYPTVSVKFWSTNVIRGFHVKCCQIRSFSAYPLLSKKKINK